MRKKPVHLKKKQMPPALPKPVSKDNAKIYSLTKELSAIGNNINQIAVKCNSLGFAEKERLFKKVDELDKLQFELETEFLSPKVDERWR